MQKQIFKLQFSSYLEAKAFCDEENTGSQYPLDIWIAKQESYLEMAQLGIAPREENLTKVVNETRITRVVDYGGGSGWIFNFLKAKGIQLIDEILIETEDSIDWFKKHNSQVTKISNLQSSAYVDEPREGIFYSNSCIQYLSDYETALSTAITPKWSYLIFEDIPNMGNLDFWTCQNYYGFINPYHIISLEHFISTIENLGYQLVIDREYKQEYPAGWGYSIKTNEGTKYLDSARSLIFKSK